jgi:hypothetical protein
MWWTFGATGQASWKNKGRQTNPGEKQENYIARLEILFNAGVPNTTETIVNSHLLSSENKKAEDDFYFD